MNPKSTKPDVDPARSRQMARVRSKDTKPEMVVRRLVHSFGYRFRVHPRDLPGRPDIVLPRLRRAIEVRGCFWHRHPDSSCSRARIPKTRPEFWLPKLEGNAVRDLVNEAALQDLGWEVLVVWECETTPGRRKELRDRLLAFLHGATSLTVA